MSKDIVNQTGNKEALELWRKVTIENVAHDPYNLSSRQLAILLAVYTEDNKYTVKSLSQRLQITKPPICRALDALSKYGLIIRQVDKDDRRIVYIESTEIGYEYLAKFSQNILDKLSEL